MIQSFEYYLNSIYEKGYFVSAVWLTIFRELFAKYIFNDWQFVGFLFVAIILDTVLAMGKVVKYQGWKELNFKEAERFFVKIFLYFGVLILSHILGNFTIHGKPNTYFTWIDGFLYFYIMAKEGLSVAKNFNALSPSLVPEILIARLTKFQKSGKVSELLKDDPDAEKPNTNPKT